MSLRDKDGSKRYWTILFTGRSAESDEEGTFVWRLRDELAEALNDVDFSDTELYANCLEGDVNYWWLNANPKIWSFAHWKMEECHNAYWEFIPTVNYIYPVALGGADSEENWATTSMLHNSIKDNWTLEQLNWKLYDAGNYEEWDGLTALFIELVKADKTLLEDSYIKKWYRLSC